MKLIEHSLNLILFSIIRSFIIKLKISNTGIISNWSDNSVSGTSILMMKKKKKKKNPKSDYPKSREPFDQLGLEHGQLNK